MSSLVLLVEINVLFAIRIPPLFIFDSNLSKEGRLKAMRTSGRLMIGEPISLSEMMTEQFADLFAPLVEKFPDYGGENFLMLRRELSFFAQFE